MANKVYSFADLEFRLHPHSNGVHASLEMSNGVYISCVFLYMSHGYEQGLWESWATNIESDPLGRSVHEINEWMAELSQLTSQQVKSMEKSLDAYEEFFSNLDDQLN